MKILSIDIGIKNLAYCLLDLEKNKYNIIKWNICDISNSVSCHLCSGIGDFYYKNQVICKYHKKELNIKQINKTIKNKKKFLESKQIKIKEEDNIDNKFQEYINNYCCKSIDKANCNKIDLITLGRNIKIKFDKLFDIDIDCVLIENQMSKIASRMKTLQGMVAQYFIEKNIKTIEFVSSKNKLKYFVQKKTNYKERKALAIDITNRLLKKNDDKWFKYFLNFSKKDDLADSFLQAISYIIYTLYLKLNDII